MRTKAQRIKQIQEGLNKGLSVFEIASRICTSRGYVYNVIKELGLKPEDVEDSPPSRALLALAPYDEIARRALARKRGKVRQSTSEDKPPEL